MGIADLKMNEPCNSYEEESYPPFLLPVYGKEDACAAFLAANGHVIKNPPDYLKSSLYAGSNKSWPAKLMEKLYSGKLGDMLESQARGLQIRKISEHIRGVTGKTRVITASNRVETYYSLF
jgi:phosphatidylinositol kinase/protein kinase (PI-3  family)